MTSRSVLASPHPHSLFDNIAASVSDRRLHSDHLPIAQVAGSFQHRGGLRKQGCCSFSEEETNWGPLFQKTQVQHHLEKNLLRTTEPLGIRGSRKGQIRPKGNQPANVLQTNAGRVQKDCCRCLPLEVCPLLARLTSLFLPISCPVSLLYMHRGK